MIVDFNTRLWTKPWFASLPRPTQILFIYSWTNDHKTISGIYELGIHTIKNELGLTEDEIRDGFKDLFPKVKYDLEAQIVWVINHIKHQFLRTDKISTKLITGINNSLNLLPIGHPFIGECVARYPLSANDSKGRTFEINYRFDCENREVKGFAASVPPAAAKSGAPGGLDLLPAPGAPSNLITFDLTTDEWHGISAEDRAHWREKYSLVDLDHKLISMGDWLKRTAKGETKKAKEVRERCADLRLSLLKWLGDDQKKLAATGQKVPAHELEADAAARKREYDEASQRILEQAATRGVKI